MATIGKWKNHKFKVSKSEIEAMKNIQIKAGSNLKESKKKKKSRVKRQGAKPIEVSITIELNAFVGCNVRHDALVLLKEARKGAKGYFYIGRKKLTTCKLMLVDATLKNPDFTASGAWIKAEVTLTLKQCSKGTINVSGGGGGKKKKKKKKKKGSRKSSVRSTSPVSPPSYNGSVSTPSVSKKTRKGTAYTPPNSTKSQTKSANADARAYMQSGKRASTTQLNQLRKIG